MTWAAGIGIVAVVSGAIAVAAGLSMVTVAHRSGQPGMVAGLAIFAAGAVGLLLFVLAPAGTWA